MPAETAFFLLLKHIGTIQKIRSFMKDELSTFLHNLGESEFRSAIASFEDAKKSSNPSREISMGITCLRLARDKFYSNAFTKEDMTFAEHMAIAMTLGIYKPARIKSGLRAIEANIVLALGYVFLEDKKMAKQFAEEANNCYTKYLKLYSAYDSSADSGQHYASPSVSTSLEKMGVKDFQPLHNGIMKIITSIR